MAYRHGVYISEVPTSIIPPVRTSSGMPVVFGTAPVNLATDPAAANAPKLCYTYAEAVAQFGYSDDWESYTLCEFIKSHFALFNVAPVVLVTNEVGLGIVPDNPLARAFRDAAGLLNHWVAAVADEVILAVAGLPMKVK